ncbi:uncharacterized protein LOC115440216 [Manduca sexta]|uniref:uncharacterized protein LOC115440216 n=1 Tax=Manduca sexta TaxID=7130 RepID=UPI00188E3650|nr:uncharacterized protein LOC115440216 [Manduca sexta]
MMSGKKSENWLLVEWSEGGRDVVYVKSVLSPLNKELKAGDVLTANRKGEAHAGTLIARARERHMLDSMIKSEEPAGPSLKKGEESEDFSASASSWEPSDEDGAMSADSDAVETKKIKLDKCKRQYSNRRSSKKILTPSNKVNAIIPKSMQQSNSINRKRSYKDIGKGTPVNKSLADSTKKHNSSKTETSQKKITIDVRELISIRNSFKALFKTIDDLKRAVVPNFIPDEEKITLDDIIPVVKATDALEETVEEYKELENNDSEEFDRSDDNVLITNKYDNQRVMQAKPTETKNGDKDWVPIGSGKTLIHADQFKKVNWRSYTIATRTLLLAVFPRRILATHSLTGKRSPAFQDKPAKMCLDPKIISDVIMEIMDRFDVKENLVRSIITTKCADECKMWKARINKKKSRSLKDRENVPPETNGKYKAEEVHS